MASTMTTATAPGTLGSVGSSSPSSSPYSYSSLSVALVYPLVVVAEPVSNPTMGQAGLNTSGLITTLNSTTISLPRRTPLERTRHPTNRAVSNWSNQQAATNHNVTMSMNLLLVHLLPKRAGLSSDEYMELREPHVTSRTARRNDLRHQGNV
jgi:hypothetical protein